MTLLQAQNPPHVQSTQKFDPTCDPLRDLRRTDGGAASKSRGSFKHPPAVVTRREKISQLKNRQNRLLVQLQDLDQRVAGNDLRTYACVYNARVVGVCFWCMYTHGVCVLSASSANNFG